MQKLFFIFFHISISIISLAQDTLYIEEGDSLNIEDYKAVYLAPDTIVEPELITYIVEKEYTLGYDIGFRLSSFSQTFQSDKVSNQDILHSFSPYIYGGLYKKGFGLYLAISSSVLSSFKIKETVYTTFTYDESTYKLVDVFTQDIDGSTMYDSVYKEIITEKTDSVWYNVTNTTSKKCRLFHIPLYASYFYPVQNFDIFGSLGVELNFTLHNNYDIRPYNSYILELGTRYYATDKFAFETSIQGKTGTIKTISSSYLNNCKTNIFSLQVGCVFCF